jgi:phage shock protein PspC (stress-responsive transcriptional regulator)
LSDLGRQDHRWCLRWAGHALRHQRDPDPGRLVVFAVTGVGELVYLILWVIMPKAPE